MQLVELQHAWPVLESQRVALFGLSYDSVDTLASFAAKRGITFPLLSDEGSHAIRDLGLLNEHLTEQHAVYGITTRDEQQGVAYPGTFVLDEHGVISEKHFEQSYRVRPTAQLFEEFALGSTRAIPLQAIHMGDARLEIQAWTDSATYRPYQQLRLHVQITLAPGMHVYAAPVPDGYTPLRLTIEPRDGLVVGDVDSPVAHPLHVDGLDEEFLAYDGTIRITVPVVITSNLGPIILAAELAYQTCSETTCFPPTSVRLDVPLAGLDLIRD